QRANSLFSLSKSDNQDTGPNNNQLSRINNYPNNALGIASSYATDQPSSSGEGAVAGQHFASLVRNATTKAIEQNYYAEQLAAKGVLGEADLTEVVLAVSGAESSLRTIIAVRDRMVQAYQEILRMPI
ncbi:MAG: flagellar hook-basal body complex protein FliE, partial [Pseudomonadota bacterium]